MWIYYTQQLVVGEARPTVLVAAAGERECGAAGGATSGAPGAGHGDRGGGQGQLNLSANPKCDTLSPIHSKK